MNRGALGVGKSKLEDRLAERLLVGKAWWKMVRHDRNEAEMSVGNLIGTLLHLFLIFVSIQCAFPLFDVNTVL